VIFVDYGKGALANVQDLIQESQRAGCMVLVDPKGYDYERYIGADVIKPNLDEMLVMVGGWKDEFDLAEKAQKIRKEASIGAILLTRASGGMTLYDDRGFFNVPAVAKEVIDVTGAGETAIAALGVGLHQGLPLEDAVELANRAAGIAVGKFGPYAVSKEEIEASSLSRHV
jgi:rfaE bifunctional protein kinase chain/domain